jgi:plastocyanin
VDDQGAEYVAWADTKANDVMLATAKSGGTFTAQAVPSSQAGWTPSVAVTPDGKTVAIAWFDSVNLDLDLAMPATGGLALARPTPTNQQPSTGPTSAATCSPNGTSLQITAPNGASASGFNTTCLAAPANTAVTVAFQNQDSTLHNFEIFTDSSATTRVGGASGLTDLVAPGTSATYKIDPLKPGSYFYRCDVHPTVMTGTFVVAAK